MFTGIIEEIGVVESIGAASGGRKLSVRSERVAAGCSPSDSVSVNGVCVTIASFRPPDYGGRGGEFTADLLQRTLDLTNLFSLESGMRVNLERALRLGDRVGGHFVLGHVDGLGRIVSRVETQGDLIIGIAVPPDMIESIKPGGSIAVDGISLTVARVSFPFFYVHCIPSTVNMTNIGDKRVGGLVNIEIDVFARYAQKGRTGKITELFLKEHGFD